MKTSHKTDYMRIVSQNYQSHKKQSNPDSHTSEQAKLKKLQLRVMLHTGEDLGTGE